MAFLGIFFAHANFPVSWSAFGVSIFYVLSGFLMIYTHGNEEMELSFGSRVRFAINKIKALYPLHILTSFFAVLLSLALFIAHGDGIKAYIELAGKTVLTVLLLQTWIPHASVSVSLNGVAWYLSVAMFLYFMFPYIAALIRQKKKRFLVICCIVILGIQIVSCIPFIYFLGDSSFVYIWFMYFFPIFRLGDFFIGCCLGRLYADRPAADKPSVFKYTVLEAAAIAVTVGVFLWLRQPHDHIVLIALHNWTTLYIPLAVIWVYLFTVNRGLITILLNNKILISLGNISGYIFLIHYIIILYFGNMLNYLDIELSARQQTVAAVLELGASILASLLYMTLETAIKKKIKTKV